MDSLVHFTAAEGEDALLRWLQHAPADDPADDLHALRQHLGKLPDLTADLRHGQAMLEPLLERVLDISRRIRARLQEMSLPLPFHLRENAQAVGTVLLEIARFIERRFALAGKDPALAATGVELALELCLEAYIVAAMSAAPAPPGLWRLANRLAASEQAPSAAYGSMLAMAAGSPESCTARQLAWIADFLGESKTGVQRLTEKRSVMGVWWVATGVDAAPVSLALKMPPVDADVLYYDLSPLGQLLGERIHYIEAVLVDNLEIDAALEIELLGAGEEAGVPPGLTLSELLSLLRLLRERWLSMPLRAEPRRRQRFTVQVSLGLRRLWEIGRGGNEDGRVALWEVFNESPGGYAIVNLDAVETEALSEISAGIVLGLRRHQRDPWIVCMVRWVRASDAQRIELGLQVLASSFRPVQLGFRGASLRGVVPALLLPPMEPLRRHRAFLAPHGTCTSRRFVFVVDGEQLYVAQARALGIDMQSASVELFRYEIDPNPI